MKERYLCREEDDPICRKCGASKSEHCESFEPIELPEGCVCDPFEWGNPGDIPPVCDEYKSVDGSVCDNCEHDKKCHDRGVER